MAAHRSLRVVPWHPILFDEYHLICRRERDCRASRVDIPDENSRALGVLERIDIFLALIGWRATIHEHYAEFLQADPQLFHHVHVDAEDHDFFVGFGFQLGGDEL